VPEPKDMNTWTGRLGHTRLRTFTDQDGHFWLEQNTAKPSKWGKLASQGHDIAWEFAGPGGAYTGRMLIDGDFYTVSEATKKFLQSPAKVARPGPDTPRPLRLSVKVIPKSSRTELVEVQPDGTWRIKVAAVPEKGKANDELCAFLAREFDVPRSRVEVVAGHTSQRKQVVIS